MKWVLFLVGPTASGKSAWALEIARRWNGVIVNADSRQFYRDARIGTACPSEADFRIVPHRLYAFLDAHARLSAGAFVQMAWEVIRSAWRDDRLPIVVGGSGLYYRALRYGLHVPVSADPAVRTWLERRLQVEGLDRLYAELKVVDPATAHRLHPHDARRILRALEIFHQTGQPSSRWRLGWQVPQMPSIAVGLHPPMARLRERIRVRNRAMWSAGWANEVKALLDAGVSPKAPVFESIGYRTIAQWIERGRSESETTLLERLDRETVDLARRQIKWFRREPDVLWWTEPVSIGVLEAFVRTRLRTLSLRMGGASLEHVTHPGS